jgi:hypothetical protein
VRREIRFRIGELAIFISIVQGYTNTHVDLEKKASKRFGC